MTISATKNLFPGVNPHLNSYLQDDSRLWWAFHLRFISTLATELDKNVSSNYYTVINESLQKDEDGDYLKAAIVYHFENSQLPGEPVAHIELISPATKRLKRDFGEYVNRRFQALRNGLSFIEIDFVHELPPTFRSLPSYPDLERHAQPYSVIIYNPDPTLEQGNIAVYLIGVDEQIPKATIPLSEADQIALDFGQIYNHIFETTRLFGIIVDYEQEPERFHRYSPQDQVTILKRMQLIRDEYGKPS